MTTLRIGTSGKQFNGFGFSFDRGLPIYLAPKLLTNKKQEEFFVANLYAQQLIYNDFHVNGLHVCKDDSNKGADVTITTNDLEIKVQVTRFTLTSYLQRKNVATRMATHIATQVLRYGEVPIPINVTIYSPNTMEIPAIKKKDIDALSGEIARVIKENLQKLGSPHCEIINCEINNQRVKKLTPLITLENIPHPYHTNYAGKDNVFINYDFDNIGFSEKDIEEEANSIYKRKEGGQSTILLIWADKAELLGRVELFVKYLKQSFKTTSFERVLFFVFYNEKHLHYSEAIGAYPIFDITFNSTNL